MQTIHDKQTARTDILALALAAAEAGRAVFPLKGKVPAIKGGNGYKDAGRDRSRVHGLFNAAPDATGYGVATGSASGVIVVDVDGPEGRREAERLELTSEYVVRTGRERDGWHVYFTIPAGVKVRTRDLAPDVELKGDGAYVAGPGSLHPSGRRYRIARGGDPPPAPDWLLEPQPGQGDPVTLKAGPVSIDVAGPPIPAHEPGRNRTLARIAGRLHDGTRDLAQLTRDLEAINEARCMPPLDSAEVAKIAASIFGREPCKPSGPAKLADAATLEALADIEAVNLWARRWPGVGGKSWRDALAALIVEARRRGERIPAGVRLEWSYAEMASAMGVSKRSLMDYRKRGKRHSGVVSRLKRHGVISADNSGRSGTERGAFVLLMPSSEARARFHHNPAWELLRRTDLTSGETLRARRLRWSARYIKRLGKTRGAAVDYLELGEGAALREELAEFLGMRKRDLERRVLAELERSGIVRFVGEIVALTDDYRERLERRRLRDGEISAEVRDLERRRRRTEEHRLTLAQPSDERERVKLPPSEAERSACEELREIADAGRERRRVREARERMRAAAKANRLAGVLREFLRRNPHRAGENASWLRVALWAEMGIPKPDQRDVERAMAALRASPGAVVAA